MKYLNRRRFYVQFSLIVFLVLLGFSGSTGVCRASSRKTIRVARFSLNNYYVQNADDTITSYDSAYLDKLSSFTHMDVSFVDCGTWVNALEMLKEHKVDLVGTMQKTDAREKDFTFCKNSYGVTIAELATLKTRHISYRDYKTIGRSTIGVMPNYVRLPQLKRLFKKQGISPKIKYYATEEDMVRALRTHDIDIMAANSHAIPSNLVVVDKFYFSPLFLVTWKGNHALADKLDNGITKLRLYDPSFDDNLTKQFFPDLLISPLNQKELECVNKHKVYTIYFGGITKPLVWCDANGEMKGILIDICDSISKKTGLSFRYQTLSSFHGKASDTDVFYVDDIYNESAESTPKSGISNSIFDSNLAVYHRIGDTYDDSGQTPYKFGIISRRKNLAKHVNLLMPNSKIVYYNTPLECIQALEHKNVDMVVMSKYVADSLIIENNITSVTSIPKTENPFGIMLKFHGPYSDTLASIVNKGITALDTTAVNETVQKYSLATVPRTTFRYLIDTNFTLVVTVLFIIIVLITIAMVAIIHSAYIKRQEVRVANLAKIKEDFYSRMSHDMRTPMNGIMGMASLAVKETDIDAMRGDINKIIDSSNYMLELINDTLDIQRMEQGKMQLEPQTVSAPVLIQNILSMVQPSAREKGVHLRSNVEKIDDNSFIQVDPVRLKQIIINLLSNAIKFTPPHGNVVITFERLSWDNNVTHNKITVADSGIGMSDDFVKNKLFQPFAQENNDYTRQYTGSGLGLSIVKYLVDLMGGSISVESEPGCGTTFTILMDFIHVEKPDLLADELVVKHDEEMLHKLLMNKRILLCEDHPLNAEISRRLLKKMDCSVDWAKNGAIGVQMFEEAPHGFYDAVLMDIRMPVMDGLQATMAIRASSHVDALTVPIIAMSANAYENDIHDSLLAGMNEHLAKPVAPEKMYRTLAKYFIK